MSERELKTPVNSQERPGRAPLVSTEENERREALPSPDYSINLSTAPEVFNENDDGMMVDFDDSDPEAAKPKRKCGGNSGSEDEASARLTFRRC